VIALTSLVLLGIATALVARAVGMPRVRVSQTLDRIEAYGYANRPAQQPSNRPLSRLVDSLATSAGERLTGRISAGDVRNDLLAAGLYRVTPTKFLGYRALAALTLPLVWLWWSLTQEYAILITIVGLPLALVLGWHLPRHFVQRRARRRLVEIDDALPELIDLLVVTVEAGLSFSASLQLAAERMTGPLGDELQLMLQEQRMGLGTDEALRNLLARADTPGMRSFVRSILQGETLGVSIGQIMRELAVEMRKRRRATAEERAQKAPIKLLFPLVFLIFPAMFVVILGPAVFSLLEAFR
jgi:tight adherence protein C